MDVLSLFSEDAELGWLSLGDFGIGDWSGLVAGVRRGDPGWEATRARRAVALGGEQAASPLAAHDV